MVWPEATDYNEAIQNPAVCFRDADLKGGQPEVNALGWPLPCSGNFAAVYKVVGADGTPWAVKCFTREVAGLRERYHAISAHLCQAKLPFTVDFEYLEEGIRIHGDWFAVVKMRWVEGLTLNDFLKGHLDKPQLVDRLAHLWGELARELRRAGIAHADLQHGNVLLVPGGKSGVLSVRLIDYDGMYVPALASSKSGEVGHANYQHPERAQRGVYDAEVDRFPNLVVYTALRALLVGGRALWDKHDNGENLLFREQDFADPARSALFRELWQLPDAAVRGLTTHLARACQGSMAEVPLLADLTEATNGKGPSESPARVPQTRTGLGGLAGGDPKPRTGILVAKKAVPADAPTTVEPIRLPRPTDAVPAPGRLDSRTLVLLGAGAAVLLLVAIVGLVVLLSGSGAEPTPQSVVGPVAPGQPFPPVDPGLPGKGQEGNNPGIAPRPRVGPVPDVTLRAGQSKLVAVRVDRRGYQGRIELHVNETQRGGAGGPLGPPMPRGVMGNPEAQTLRVETPVILQPGQVEAQLRVTAGAAMTETVRDFEVVAWSDQPGGGQAFGPVGGPLPKAGPPGAGLLVMPGGKDMGEPGQAVFRVTVNKAPRSNPGVLPVGVVVRGQTRELQVDVVRAGVLSLGYNPEAQTVAILSNPALPDAGENLTPAETIRPQRLVVVSATFPYREQVEAFRKALRVATLEDLFADPDTAPRFVGLNVSRREVRSDGGRTPWEPLYRIDPVSDRINVHPTIEKLLREAAYDRAQAERIATLTFPGLATPLPALAIGTYPSLRLTGIDVQGEEEGVGNLPPPVGVPGMKGPGLPIQPQFGPPVGGVGQNVKLRHVPVKRLPQELMDRLTGKFFAFDPRGLPPDAGPEGPSPLKPPQGHTVPPGKPRPGPDGPAPRQALGGEPPAKCLVRFFDADAQPGRVYEYSLQVCMANPNHGKRARVDTEEEARPRHLLSPEVVTPPVATGTDYQVYAVDQQPLASKIKGLYSGNNRGVDTSPVTADLAPVQIQRWLGEYHDAAGITARVLGDWIVAERLLVPRGEPLGRSHFLTQVPEWNPAKGRFEFASAVPGRPRLPSKAAPNPSILLGLEVEEGAPLLVDFHGGKRDDYHTPRGLIRDEGAVEVLILAPDGSLDVRNSRADADRETAAGRERQLRYEAWRQRLQEIRATALENPALPGAGKEFGPNNPGVNPRPFNTTPFRWWYMRGGTIGPGR